MKTILFGILFFMVTQPVYCITETEIRYNQDRINYFCNIKQDNVKHVNFNDGSYLSQYCLQALNNKILIDIYNEMLKRKR